MVRHNLFQNMLILKKEVFKNVKKERLIMKLTGGAGGGLGRLQNSRAAAPKKIKKKTKVKKNVKKRK